MKRRVINCLSAMLLAVFVLAAGGCDNSGYVSEFGDPLRGLTEDELALFELGLVEFADVKTVGKGLGPIFNSTSCANCHRDPAVGGTDDVRALFEIVIGAETDGVFDPLVDLGGPVLQRFGVGVEIVGCPTGEAVPPEAAFVAMRQIPPLFGAGLMEAIPAGSILANADPADSDGNGISGRANFDGEGTLTRFGWKANIPDLDTFSGAALLFELGITNPFDPTFTLFEQLPNGEPIPEGCDLLAEPEVSLDVVEAIASFQRLLAPAPRGAITDEVERGEGVFEEVGCAGCHIPSLRTGASAVEALSDKDVDLFSDLLLHDVGELLADGIEAGDATGNEFRTAPLWGLGARKFFLHDARTQSLDEAIKLHEGEAAAARDSYLALPPGQVNDLLRFLESL